MLLSDAGASSITKISRSRQQHRDRIGGHAEPDGYTVLLVNPANYINARCMPI